MRCDLHVHTRFSGPVDLPVLRHVARECYSAPQEVYDAARARGMDLVTVTDHDSIAGGLALAARPEVFLSEEVTLMLPEKRSLHLGVFDITEPQHERIARLRLDPEALFAYLFEERIPACVNHLFSAVTGHRQAGDLSLPLGRVPLIETRNGAMPERQNEAARQVGSHTGMAPVGGSDSHSLAGVGRTWTEVRGARSKAEFLDGLRRGLTIAGGASGSLARLTAEVFRVVARALVEAAAEVTRRETVGRGLAALLLGPLVPLVPALTSALYLHERRFGDRWCRIFRETHGWPLPQAPVAAGPLGTTHMTREAA